MTTPAADRLPARALPLLYFGTAHISLAVAFVAAAWRPRAVAGFFYHSWLVGLVHLITLGWISFSIVGAFYVVGPVALRMPMKARRADYIAYAAAVIGLVGMVAHFWIQEYGGMAWSAGTVAVALLCMTIRMACAIRQAAVERAVKVHLVLACANFWIAASMGLLIAIDKVAHILPGFVLSNVIAHAHLAALGWATMMIVGVGYRMVPMILPSKMPSGWSVYASAVMLETGVLGLFVTLLVRSRVALAFGGLVAAGLIAFAVQVGWMLRHRVRPPVAMHRFDFARLHVTGAAVCLVGAMTIGLVLLAVPASPRTLRAAAAYGVLGLLGFLAQMIVGMQTRLLPMAAWYWAYAASSYRVPPTSPHTMRDRFLQTIVFVGWTLGVAALAAGMFLESPLLVSVGAWGLLVAVALGAIDNAFVVAPAFGRTRRHTSQDSGAKDSAPAAEFFAGRRSADARIGRQPHEIRADRQAQRLPRHVSSRCRLEDPLCL